MWFIAKLNGGILFGLTLLEVIFLITPWETENVY